MSHSLSRPERQTTNVVFTSAHSGRVYPPEFRKASVLDQLSLRSSEDAFVDMLFEAAPTFGAPLLKAEMPRAFVDLNRSPDELDPALISGIRSVGSNPRIASGLGVIPRVVSGGRTIYNGKISMEEAQARLDQVWSPYHREVETLLAGTKDMFGSVILIDCHSMPREAIEALGHFKGKGPDVVLGDRFGASAGSDIVARLEDAFRRVGLVVARNSPFAGAFTAQHYGRPSRGQHVIQVEIDRSLYMDEETLELNDGFPGLKNALTKVVEDICSFGQPAIDLAAE